MPKQTRIPKPGQICVLFKEGALFFRNDHVDAVMLALNHKTPIFQFRPDWAEFNQKDRPPRFTMVTFPVFSRQQAEYASRLRQRGNMNSTLRAELLSDVFHEKSWSGDMAGPVLYEDMKRDGETGVALYKVGVAPCKSCPVSTRLMCDSWGGVDHLWTRDQSDHSEPNWKFNVCHATKSLPPDDKAMDEREVQALLEGAGIFVCNEATAFYNGGDNVFSSWQSNAESKKMLREISLELMGQEVVKQEVHERLISLGVKGVKTSSRNGPTDYKFDAEHVAYGIVQQILNSINTRNENQKNRLAILSECGQSCLFSEPYTSGRRKDQHKKCELGYRAPEAEGVCRVTEKDIESHFMQAVERNGLDFVTRRMALHALCGLRIGADSVGRQGSIDWMITSVYDAESFWVRRLRPPFDTERMKLPEIIKAIDSHHYLGAKDLTSRKYGKTTWTKLTPRSSIDTWEPVEGPPESAAVIIDRAQADLKDRFADVDSSGVHFIKGRELFMQYFQLSHIVASIAKGGLDAKARQHDEQRWKQNEILSVMLTPHEVVIGFDTLATQSGGFGARKEDRDKITQGERPRFPVHARNHYSLPLIFNLRTFNDVSTRRTPPHLF
jgi:hypothetical protein